MSDPAISVRIENGWWGNEVGVCVACAAGTVLQPRTLIVDGQSVSLTPKSPGEWWGKVRLQPKQDRSRRGGTYFVKKTAGFVGVPCQSLLLTLPALQLKARTVGSH